MTAHTPGPWHVEVDRHQLTPHPYHEHRFIIAGDGIVARMSDSATQAADARLIAAAPAMLEALEYIAGHADLARTLANDAGRLASLDYIAQRAHDVLAKVEEVKATEATP